MIESTWAFGWEGRKNETDGSQSVYSGVYVVDVESGMSRKEWAAFITKVGDFLRNTEPGDFLRITFMVKLCDAKGESEGD